MELVLQPGSPARSIAGITVVAALHAAVVLGLLLGLARNPAQVKPAAPIELIPLVDPLPPKPSQRVQQPVEHRIVSVMRLPEVPIAIEKFPAMAEAILPAADQAPGRDTDRPAQPAFDGARSAVTSRLATACPNAQGVRSAMRYPVQARREGLQGEVLARLVVDANGDISQIGIVSSSHRAFNAAVLRALRQLNCVGQGREVTVEVPFSFRLE